MFIIKINIIHIQKETELNNAYSIDFFQKTCLNVSFSYAVFLHVSIHRINREFKNSLSKHKTLSKVILKYHIVDGTLKFESVVV